jgi:hypothetical protein
MIFPGGYASSPVQTEQWRVGIVSENVVIPERSGFDGSLRHFGVMEVRVPVPGAGHGGHLGQAAVSSARVHDAVVHKKMIAMIGGKDSRTGHQTGTDRNEIAQIVQAVDEFVDSQGEAGGSGSV